MFSVSVFDCSPFAFKPQMSLGRNSEPRSLASAQRLCPAAKTRDCSSADGLKVLEKGHKHQEGGCTEFVIKLGLAASFEEPTYLVCVNVLTRRRFQN